MVFLVAMYASESCTLKKAERWRIDAFELWGWRRLLRVPRTAKKSIQSILKEISPEYSLEGLMLKLKLQYFGHLMWRTDSFEKTLMLGKIDGRRRRGRQRTRWHYWFNGLEFEQPPGVGKGQGSLGFPVGSEVKASACNAGDLGSIPGLGRSPGEGNGNPLQYSCLENPMNGGAWWATVYGVAKSRTQLSE